MSVEGSGLDWGLKDESWGFMERIQCRWSSVEG